MTADFLKGLITDQKINIEFNVADYDWHALHELLTVACEHNVNVKLNVTSATDYELMLEVIKEIPAPEKRNLTVRFMA